MSIPAEKPHLKLELQHSSLLNRVVLGVHGASLIALLLLDLQPVFAVLGCIVIVGHGLFWRTCQRCWAAITELEFTGDRLQLLVEGVQWEVSGYRIVLRRPWLVVIALQGYGPLTLLPLMRDSLVCPNQWRPLCAWQHQI